MTLPPVVPAGLDRREKIDRRVTLRLGPPVRLPMSMTTQLEASRFSPTRAVRVHVATPAARRALTRYIASRIAACEVEDLVQATLCEALASGRAPDDERDLERWLLGIARFKIADTYRASARTRAEEIGDLAAPGAPPMEAISLAHWAARQLPSGDAAARTLGWMMREADGDKLEAIAADEDLPAERVRQRVSRLRRWMRDRWMAELAAVAALALLGVVAVRALVHHEVRIAPDVLTEPASEGAGLRRAWKLVAFEPAQPLSARRAVLLERLRSSLVIVFDGRTARASALNGTFERGYGATIAPDSTLDLDLGEGHLTK
ncbi:MAG: sigma-70 family RNA polymerase sigma factor, partial [Byssovorax sp.]